MTIRSIYEGGVKDARYWIDVLELRQHPEGGFFRETYRSEERIQKTGLPQRFAGQRAFATAIYYLLRSGEISALHRIKSDEVWLFHSGSPLSVYAIDHLGSLSVTNLGLDLDAGQRPQRVIPANTWFGANLEAPNSYTLVSCIVAPGFEFEDFELADKTRLSEMFPQHKGLIEVLTKGEQDPEP